MKAFFTAFLQVLFVCSNTVMIAKGNYYGILVCSLLISLFWTFNVRAAMGNWQTRALYCSGAALGSITGVYFSHLILG